MTNHPTSEELFAFRDGELGLEKRGLVEAHVLSCSACLSRLDEMSDAEGMLRQRHAEPDESYFDTMTQSVMSRVAPGGREAPRSAPAPARTDDSPVARETPAARGIAAETPGVRPGRRRSLEDEPRGRAPRLPWPAIVSAVSAAAAVLVVVVLLFQRQDAWRHAPEPAVVGLGKDAGGESKEATPALPAPAEPGAPEEPGAPAEQAPVGKMEASAKSDEALAPVASSTGQTTAANRPETEIRTENAADAASELALRKSAAAAAAPEAAERARTEAEPQAPAAGAGAEGESAFAPIAARYGLPLLYDPSSVSSDALLKAEPDLRFIYQTGRAGEDSARVRLYLAEAARARAGDSPDTETFDTIVHHYQRAVRLARDPETARMAMKRLEDFVSRNAPPR
ncbi:MAG TPA: hypothetical protein VFS09_02650 [Candidatus Eisenbacteria bacterium]|nr:hypothetical protein [Candidatus Eisenbacteria bacterium]